MKAREIDELHRAFTEALTKRINRLAEYSAEFPRPTRNFIKLKSNQVKTLYFTNKTKYYAVSTM